MKPANPYDVVIVGAGPAGSMASLVLARAGRRVALLDRSSFPRTKVCGDCVNPSCWEIFDRNGLSSGFEKLPHQQLTGLRVQFGDKTVFEADFDTKNPRGERAVERKALDNWLVNEAIAAGVHFFPETIIKSLSMQGIVQTSQGPFFGRIILGADGRNSQIARLAGLHPKKSKQSRVAWQADLPGEASDMRLQLRAFPEGYYGLARTSADVTNLCLVIYENTEMTPQEIAQRYFPGTPTSKWQSLYPLKRKPSKLGEGCVWLAGDSARLTEPFTGEGIYFALASGELAARCINLGWKTGKLAAALENYRIAHARLYRKRVWVNDVISWFAQTPRRAAFGMKLFSAFPVIMQKMHQKLYPTLLPAPKAPAPKKEELQPV